MQSKSFRSLSGDARLPDLIVRWEEMHQAGCDVSPEDLCRDCPDLLAALREHLQALQAMNAVLAAGQLEMSADDAPAPPGATMPLPGQTLGAPPRRIVDLPAIPGYEILEELGRGGMGVVYEARQLRLGRLVALKMILSGARARAVELARFRTEAEAVARLQHPNIVQIYEVGEHEGLPFFSLELCTGGSLEVKLGGDPMPPAQAAQLLQTLARAMHAAHLQHVVHRDLKPANVLFTADGIPKITDFGLAKKLDEVGQTQTGTAIGTPSYMAPEQVDGNSKEVGPAADVYALGVILYEMLTGRPPFRAATVLDTLMQVRNNEPVPPRCLLPTIPRDLETICLKCLQKAPARRYGSALALADDLRRFLGGEPILGRPVGVSERAARWARRRPALAALLGAGAAALVVLVGLVVYHNQTLRDRVAEAVASERRESQRAAEAEKREQRSLRFQKEKYKRMATLLASLHYSHSGLPALPPGQDVRLRVGIASEVRGGVREGFQAYQIFRNEYFRRNGFRFELELNSFEGRYSHRDALKEFRSPARGNYDILLIDDPWLAVLHQDLTPFDEVPAYREYLDRKPPLTAFVPSLEAACRYPDKGKLYGLPLVGNVQVLMYRKDRLPPRFHLPVNQWNEGRLRSIERLREQSSGGAGAPFVVRYRDDGSLTEQFWEVLRCYGYRDAVKDGKVVVPRALAVKAMDWLRRMDPRGKELGHDDDFVSRQLLAENEPEMVLCLSWPSSLIRELVLDEEKRPLAKKIGVHMASSNPVMGTWLLVIPKTCRHKEEALRAILTLTLSRDFVLYLARRGCVPVAKTPLTDDERRDIPFLADNDNHAIIREALQRASPRPRTPGWEKIETEVGECLLQGRELRSIKGCLVVE